MIAQSFSPTRYFWLAVRSRSARSDLALSSNFTNQGLFDSGTLVMIVIMLSSSCLYPSMFTPHPEYVVKAALTNSPVSCSVQMPSCANLPMHSSSDSSAASPRGPSLVQARFWPARLSPGLTDMACCPCMLCTNGNLSRCSSACADSAHDAGPHNDRNCQTHR